MSIANPLWGAPRIHGELLKLGIDAGQTISSKGGTQPDLRRLVEGGSGMTLPPVFIQRRLEFWRSTLPSWVVMAAVRGAEPSV